MTHTAAHGENEQPKPATLKKGMQYVFHHNGPLSIEQLALKGLPSRLSQLGFKVIESPKSARDLSYPYIGGPLFFIAFSDGKHEGAIFNRLHHIPRKPGDDTYWIIEDYIIVYVR
jgi:hypothetical protein